MKSPYAYRNSFGEPKFGRVAHFLIWFISVCSEIQRNILLLLFNHLNLFIICINETFLKSCSLKYKTLKPNFCAKILPKNEISRFSVPNAQDNICKCCSVSVSCKINILRSMNNTLNLISVSIYYWLLLTLLYFCQGHFKYVMTNYDFY